MNEVMTAKEVAEFFKISVNAVYAMRNDGKLKPLDLPGLRFSREEVEAFTRVYHEYSPSKFLKLTAENSRLTAENAELKSRIKKVTSELLVISQDVL